MKAIFLGLFDWQDRLLNSEQTKAVARIFLDVKSNTEMKPDGHDWFKGQICYDKMLLDVSVTHSRIIIQHTDEDKIDNIRKLREKRHELRLTIEAYLQEKAKALSESQIGRKIFRTQTRLHKFKTQLPKALLFVYPLIILGKEDALYTNYFRKGPFEKWTFTDLSTTCFFSEVEDTGFGILSRHKIYMRISGSSLIMGEASDRFMQRVVNTLYYSGLYRMTRLTKEERDRLEVKDYVHYGLEPLLEQQGDAIASQFTQRSIEEKLISLSGWLILLTVAVIVATVMVPLLQAFHILPR